MLLYLVYISQPEILSIKHQIILLTGDGYFS